MCSSMSSSLPFTKISGGNGVDKKCLLAHTKLCVLFICFGLGSGLLGLHRQHRLLSAIA
jgi:hypothetical protein